MDIFVQDKDYSTCQLVLFCTNTSPPANGCGGRAPADMILFFSCPLIYIFVKSGMAQLHTADFRERVLPKKFILYEMAGEVDYFFVVKQRHVLAVEKRSREISRRT